MNSFLKEIEETKINSKIKGIPFLKSKSVKKIKKQFKNCGTKEVATLVGKLIAEKALKKGIKNIVFDRGGYIYHGRVKNLAEAARENGLIF